MNISRCAMIWDGMVHKNTNLRANPAGYKRIYLHFLVDVIPTSSVLLTHWGRDKMDAISQTTCSSAFSWMKMFDFLLKFHWSLFLRVKLTKFQHWFTKWLGAGQATSHYLNQWWSVYWRIYASLGLNELIVLRVLVYALGTEWVTNVCIRQHNLNPDKCVWYYSGYVGNIFP